jgi:hypothetical protein
MRTDTDFDRCEDHGICEDQAPRSSSSMTRTLFKTRSAEASWLSSGTMSPSAEPRCARSRP